jgi:serine/threonine protein kinase
MARMSAASAPWLDRLVGTTLIGRYRVDRKVGAGAHGTVFVGHHLWLNVPIALKVLHALDHAPNAERFVAEARMLANLRHPNIVSVLDAGVLDDPQLPRVPWMVMEWCEGESLASHLGRRGALSVHECVGLLRPVVEAVAYAHGRGVVHRDLKPGNVMLARDSATGAPSARVLDFGIAKVMDVGADPTGTATATATRSFTPAYAAPEQVAGDRTGPWTDVHALGLLFTEVLCGRPPYPGATLTEIHGAVFAARRPTPAAYGVAVGPLEAVVAAAVAVRPQDRHPDAARLLEAIDATRMASASTPMPPPPHATFPSTGAPLTYAAPAPAKRAVWPWLLAAVAVVLLVAGGLALAVASGSEASGRKSKRKKSAAATATVTATATATATATPAAGIDGAAMVRRLRELGFDVLSESRAPTFGCESHLAVAILPPRQASVTTYHCIDEHAAELVHSNLAEHPSSAPMRPYSAFLLRGVDVLAVSLPGQPSGEAEKLLRDLVR